ncbi:MAG TPA: hypothetical protein VIV40_36155 [Kofleriaceae bacterium]
MNEIVERAGTLGLFTTANALADAKLDPHEAPRDARLTEEVGSDIKRIFAQMARRGCDPVLITALWAKLARRPLERALVAIDVLAQTIWSNRDPMLVELRAAASILGAARTKFSDRCIDLNAHPASELIAKYARTHDLPNRETVELLTFAYDHHLGALDELHRRGDDLLAKPGTRDSIRAFARLASLARLPTLASVYFDWLMRVLDWRVPALDLCETLFDAGVAQKIPGTAIQAGDIPELEQRDVAEYLTYRAHLSVGDTQSAHTAVVQNMAARPRWIGPPGPRVDVVRAHLGALFGGQDDVTLARVEAACADDQLWRYGARVRAIVGAKRAPSRAIELFHAYVGAFGNDYDTSLAVISLGPEHLKRDVTRILAREAFHLPHEPGPWKLLGHLFGVGKQVAAEVDGRLRTQLL